MRKVEYILKILCLAIAYFITAKWGLALDAVSGFATLVWPPTGISLAALILFGSELWPGVFLGAFLANFNLNASIPVCLGIASGNTLEAFIGFYLLNRMANFHSSLNRVRDILSLIFFATICSTLVSALIGPTVLLVGKVINSSSYLSTVGAWWLGDALGNLIVAPFLFAWIARPFHRLSFARCSEIVLMTAAIILMCLFMGKVIPLDIDTYPLTYLIFPIVIWICFRHGLRGATSATFLLSAVAIVGTIHHLGPFARESLNQSLMYLQIFVGTVALTSLILASLVEASQVANKAKSSFLATISHEIRTPLGSILGFADILQTQILPREDQIKYLEIITRSGQQLSKLINDVLDLSKMEAGRLEVEDTSIDLESLLSEVVSLLNINAQMKGLEFSVSYDENIPKTFYSDATKIRQILLNIVGNAIKFTEKGSVTVQVQLIKAEKNKFITFIIKDTGIGLRPEQAERLFHPFSQADSTMTRRFGGTGLGLYISKKMAQLLAGDVVLVPNKEPASGCTFKITIPYKDR